MSEADRRMFEVIIEGCLEAVHEQYVLPLTLALGTLTAAACRDPDSARQIADALRQQAESCPPDVAGRTLLTALAGLADGPRPLEPDAVQDALRRSLRLIPGGRQAPEPGG